MERERGVNPLFSFPFPVRSVGRRASSRPGSRHGNRRFRPSLRLEALESRALLSGTFTALVSATPNAASTMMLETDGTVLMQGGGLTNAWYRLTPDSSGSYVNGTWTRVASMSLPRLYYGSIVLPDGRVMVQGGEYSGTQSQETDSNAGEIYNSVTNTWSGIAPFPEPNFGDDCLEVLPNGTVLAGYINGPQTFIYNPATNVWSQGPTKLRNDQSDEENWVELPGGSILSYDIWASNASGVAHAQLYLPATNTWVDAGIVPVALSSAANGDELGAGLLLSDGRVFYLGATGNTAYYTPSTNSWTAGPVIPDGLVTDDAPAADLPDGDILFTADTPLYQGPAHIFEFNPTTNTYTDLTSELPTGYLSGPSFADRMLVLPTGQVLLNNGSSQLYVFTPGAGPQAIGVPSITGISENPDGSFLLSGTLLNGISQGAYYGDDAQMSTNYPIVQLTDANNDVFYARTYNWSSTGLATGTTPESTDFTLPPGLPAGTYAVRVVANGFASTPTSLTIPTLVNDPAATIASAAAATSNPVTGTTTNLSVLGADPVEGASTLTYTWAATLVPSGVIFPSFSANGTNAAQSVTVTFYHAGTYRLQATITNLAGLSSTSSVTVVVNQSATSVTVSPTPAGVSLGASQQFTASAQDQFGLTMTVQPSFVWSIASGAGTISTTGLYTAPNGSTGTLAAVTATTVSGSASGSTLAYVLSSAWSTQDIGGVGIAGAAGDNGSGTFGVVGSGIGLVGVDDDSFRFVYQSATGDSVVVAQIASQQSQSTSAFAGVMIRGDLTSGGLMAAMGITPGGVLEFVDRTTASTVTSNMSGTPSSPPSWVRLIRSGNTFTGYFSYDGVVWTEFGSATIAMGSTVYAGLAVTSASSTVLDTAMLTNVSVDSTPVVVTAASAAPGIVTGTTTNLAVLGGDALGESTLTYTWAATSVPTGASSPAFAVNGTNGAKNDMVTFAQAGNYTFTVTIANPGGLSATSSVVVTVDQTLTGIVVSPATAALSSAATQSFSAVADDQFGQALASQPTFTWSVAGGGIGGTVSATGLYTRPSPGVGSDTVEAAAGAQSGTAAVTVTAGKATQLVVTTQPPSSVTAGSPFPLVVAAEDNFGNVDPTFQGSVTLPPANNPATLGGPVTVMASMGVATFSGLLLDQAAGGVTLQATSADLGTATTASFAVNAASAAQLAVMTEPPSSVVAGSGFGLAVDVEDAFGNLVAGFSGSVMLALADNPGNATLGGTVTVNASQGVASFAGLTLNKTSSSATLQAASTGLGGVTTSAITVTPAAAAQLVVASQPPASVTAGQAFGLQVEALDAFGNVATGFSGSVALDLADNPGGGSLTGTFTTTAVIGVAVFANVMLDEAGVGYVLGASSTGVGIATSSPFTVTAAAATQLVTTPAPSAGIAAGSEFGLTVSAEDLYGNLVPSFLGTVTLAIENNPGGATLGGATSVTASGGVATFSNLSLNRPGAGYILQASSGGLSSAETANFTVAPAGATQLVILTQPPGSVTAGAGFTVVVEGEDSFGNLGPNFSGSVMLALVNNPGGLNAMPGGPLTATADAGLATFNDVLLDKAGADYTLQASSGNLIPATTNAITVSAAAATQLAINGPPPATVIAGSPFELVVAGEDPYGNVDPGFSGSVTLALAGNPAGDSLGGTLSENASAGLATFAALTLTKAASGDTLHASSSLPDSVTTSPFQVAAATATQLVVTTEPAPSVTAGSGFGLVVTTEDAYGNLSTSFSGAVTLALSNNPAGDTLGGLLTVPVSAGMATFGNLTLDKVASGDTLVASSPLGPDVTKPIAVIAAAATQLVVTSQPPASVVAGEPFAVTVTAEDNFGNTDLTYTGQVTLGLGASPVGATLGGTLLVAAAGGVASWTGLTLDKAGGGYALRASSGVGAVTTAPVTVSPGAATQLVVTTGPPQSMVAGSMFGLVVMAEDSFGNLDPTYAAMVTLALAANPAGDTLGGTLLAAASGGVVAFPDLTLDKVTSGVAVVVSSGTLPMVTTGPIAVGAAAAAQLVVTSQPAASVTAGASFGLIATAEDRFGNVASSDNGAVTVALAPSSDSGALGGTLTVMADAGQADFTGLTLTTAATGVQLQVTSDTLGGATSDPFAIVAAPATQLVVTTQPQPSVIAGNGFDVVVQAEDPFGNTDPSFTGPVTLALANGPKGATLGGTLDLVAEAGVASFSGLILDKVGPDETLQATSSGFAAATTNPSPVAAAAVAQLSVTTQPPAGVTAGTTFGLTVAAEDRFGNVNPSFAGSVTLTLPNSLAGDTLGGTLIKQAGAGTVLFSDLSLTKSATGDTIQASSAGLAPVTTDPFAVTAAAASQLVVTTQPPANLTAGNGFDLIVEAEDPYGNTDPSFSSNVTLALANPSGGAALGGTATETADAGVATFTGLSLNKAGTAYSLQASSNGVSGVATDPIAVSAGAATQLVVANPPPPSVTAGAGFGLVVLAEDAFGNVDTNFSSSVALASSDGEPVGGTLTLTASAGAAAFTGLTLDTAAAASTLLVSSSGLARAATSSITVTAAPASRLVVTSQPPGSLTAGSEFGVAVSAEDRFGNVDPNFAGSVLLSLASGPGGSSLGGSLAVSATSGVAMLSGLTLNRAAAGYALEASSSGLASAPSNPIEVGPAPASQFFVSAQPPGTVNADGSFGVVVLAEDRFGNVDPNYGGSASLALATNPGNATLRGTMSVTVQGGVATFTGVTISQGGSGYTLDVTSSGLSGAVTSAIAVIPPLATVSSVSVQNESVARHKTSTVIVIAFQEPLNGTAAANLGSYTLHTAAQGKAHKTKGIALSRATYNPVTNTVTLVPRNKLMLRPPVQLQINASILTDALGRPLDGNDDGQPGGNFVATLSKGGKGAGGALTLTRPSATLSRGERRRATGPLHPEIRAAPSAASHQGP